MPSKQDRFQQASNDAQVWGGFIEVGQRMFTAPVAVSEVSKYDEYMINAVLPCDLVLPGMIAKLVNAFAGAGWTIVGPARTANRASLVLENADGGRGWFHFVEACAKSYVMRNAGCFVELAREFVPDVDPQTGELRSDLAPVTGIYNMDSTKARWVRDRVNPLRYENRPWGWFDFFHLVHSPGDTDATRRRGESPLYLCLEYVKLLGLVNAWEQGSLDPDFIDALMLLTGASEEQFGQAMRAREKAIDEKGNAAKRLAVLANLTEEVKAQLLFLRKRPESLEDFESRVRMIYEIYAMNLGRDVTYWFPSQYSGRAYRTRSEVQSEERQAVESNVFHPKLQEAVQRYVMPASVHFSFDNPSVTDRDYLFRLREFVELGKLLYEAEQGGAGGILRSAQGQAGQGAGSVGGEGSSLPLATREEVRRFLAGADARFELWTVEQEPVTESSEDQELMRSLPEVETAVAAYRRGDCSDEPVVRYGWRCYPSGKQEVHCRQVSSLAVLAQPRVWVMPTQTWLVADTISDF